MAELTTAGEMSASSCCAPEDLSESNYFESRWQESFWGSNYSRLQGVKKAYDPDGLFFVHHGVGSEHWSDDGFTRLASS